MILDTQGNLGRYAALFRGFDPARLFAWLETCGDLEAGTRVDFAGEQVFAAVNKLDTVPTGNARWETHREYVDLQYIVDGGETIEWAPATALSADGDYDAPRDVQFYGPSAAHVTLPMVPGKFVFLWPADAHKPGVADGAHGFVHKIVVKVHISLLVV